MSWRALAVSLSLTLIGAGAQAEGPLPVSPGGQEGMVVVSGRCPTFNWTAVEGAEPVDLVVYRVPEDDVEGAPRAVLAVTLPGSANGWTPAVGQCLEAGGRCAWSVRAGEAWSEASLFEVAKTPSVTEVEEAMAVLRRLRCGPIVEGRASLPRDSNRVGVPTGAQARGEPVEPLVKRLLDLRESRTCEGTH